MESDSQLEARGYEQQAHGLEQQGDHAGAIRLMERALLLRTPQSLAVPGGAGGDSKEQAERLLAAERLVVKYNTVAVRCFKTDDYDSAMNYLNNALKLTEPTQPHSGGGSPFDSSPEDRLRLRGTTFNNLGCLERRRGRMELALNYLQLSVEHGGEHSASTFLNMSAILNSLGRPQEAAGAARRAVGLYEAALSDPSATAAAEEARNNGVLAIAYHNLAMSLETIEPMAANEAYWTALDIARRELGPTSGTTQAIEKNKNRFSQSISRRGFSQHQQGNSGLLPPISSPGPGSRAQSRGARGRGTGGHSQAQGGSNRLGGTPRAQPQAIGYSDAGTGMPQLPRRNLAAPQQQQQQQPQPLVSGSRQQGGYGYQSGSQTARGASAREDIEESPMYSRPQPQPPNRGAAPVPPTRSRGTERGVAGAESGTPAGMQLPRRQMGASKGPAPLPRQQQQDRQPTPPAEDATGRGAPSGRPQQYNTVMTTHQQPTAPNRVQQQQQQPPQAPQQQPPQKSTMISRQGAEMENRFNTPQQPQPTDQSLQQPQPESWNALRKFSESRQPPTAKELQAAQPPPAVKPAESKPKAYRPAPPQTAADALGSLPGPAPSGRRTSTQRGGLTSATNPYSTTGLPGEDGRKEDLVTFLTNRLTNLLKAEEDFESRYGSAVKIQCLARRRQAAKNLSNRRRKRMEQTMENQKIETMAAARVVRFFRLIMLKRRELLRKQQQEQIVKDERRDAAVKIQSCARRWLAKNKVKRLRTHYKNYNKSLRVLQCWFRQELANNQMKRMRAARNSASKSLLDNEVRDRCAKDIQRVFRAYKSMQSTNKIRGSVRAANERERQTGRVYGAKRIQCAWRGYAVRKISSQMLIDRDAYMVERERIERRRSAVVTIQRLIRGFLSRRRSSVVKTAFLKKKHAMQTQQKEFAATKIQCQMRKFLAAKNRKSRHAAYYDHKRQLNLQYRGAIISQYAWFAVGCLDAYRREHALLTARVKALRLREQDNLEQTVQQQLEEERRQREKDAILRHQRQELEWRQTIRKQIPQPPPPEPAYMQKDNILEVEDVVPLTPEQLRAQEQESALPVKVPEAQQEDESTSLTEKTPAKEAEVEVEKAVTPEEDRPAPQPSAAEDDVASPSSRLIETQPTATEERTEAPSSPEPKMTEPVVVVDEESAKVADAEEEEEEEEEPRPRDFTEEPLMPHEEGWVRPQPTEQPIRLRISAEYLENKRKVQLQQRIEQRLVEMETKEATKTETAINDPILVAEAASRRNKAALKIQALYRGAIQRDRIKETRKVLVAYLDEVAEAGRITPPPVEKQMVFSVIDEVESSQKERLTAKRQQMVVNTLQTFGRAVLANKEMIRRKAAHQMRRNEAAHTLCNARRLVLAKKETRSRRATAERARLAQSQLEDEQIATEFVHSVALVQAFASARCSAIHRSSTLDLRQKTMAHARLSAFYRLIGAKAERKRRQTAVDEVIFVETQFEERTIASIKIQKIMRRALAKNRTQSLKTALSEEIAHRAAREAAEDDENMASPSPATTPAASSTAGSPAKNSGIAGPATATTMLVPPTPLPRDDSVLNAPSADSSMTETELPKTSPNSAVEPTSHQQQHQDVEVSPSTSNDDSREGEDPIEREETAAPVDGNRVQSSVEAEAAALSLQNQLRVIQAQHTVEDKKRLHDAKEEAIAAEDRPEASTPVPEQQTPPESGDLSSPTPAAAVVDESSAATSIQAAFKGHKARKATKKKLEDKKSEWEQKMKQAQEEDEAEVQRLSGTLQSSATPGQEGAASSPTVPTEQDELRKEDSSKEEERGRNQAAATVQRGFRVHQAKKEADRRRSEKDEKMRRRREAAAEAEAQEAETLLSTKQVSPTVTTPPNE